jgi:two-component system osmolarity sensor histidine kinase EnvZ
LSTPGRSPLDLKAGDDFRLPAVELDRILSNLVENAFTYGAPPLCIATSRNNGGDRLSVRDHGKGMPEAHFARALRPFVRIDPARGGDAHCGLGLTIVRRLTRRYGGDLSTHNADGGGLAVVLDFPLRVRA